jgi:4-amino-4-deoxy-L-arabinose transferase-like glycosyltransferase
MTGLALVAILAGAVAARFLDLETNPGGLFPDEAAEAITASQILYDPGYRPVFVPENGGREALFAYTVAVGFAVGGESVLTLRAVAALWGVLGVLAIWLLARRYGRGVGLAAAAWAAGSLWLLAISRDGMRNTILPFFCAVALLGLIAWVDRPSRLRAALAGGVLALAALYTYQPLKLLPLLALLWLLWLRARDRDLFARILPGLLAFVATFAVVAAPMVAAAIANPQAWLGRAIGVTPFNPGLVPEEDLGTHLLRTIGMFGFAGDPNARHDVAAIPLLDVPMTVLSIVGVILLWRRRREPTRALILFALPLMLLPPLIATEGGSPHFLRALGLAAPLAVVVGLGTQELVDSFIDTIQREAWLPAGLRSNARNVSLVMFSGALLLLGIRATATYLERPEADRYLPFSYDLVAMAEVATTSDAVILDEFSALTVTWLARDHPPVVLRPGEPLPSGPDGRPAVDRVFARTVGELQGALGDGGAYVQPVAGSPAGTPTVWVVNLR